MAGQSPFVRFLHAAVLTFALALTVAASASAGPGVRYGIQDDAWLLHGPGTLDARLDTVSELGVDVVRFNLHWDVIEPRRGQPDWTASDAVLKGLRARRIAAVVGLVGSPRWANGGRGPNWAPRAAHFAAFARAAARRYPWVRDWLIWNEPNQARWLRPTAASLYVRALLNPAYAAIHGVRRNARVAGGVTAPRAGSAGVSPVDWIRGMAKSKPKLDAYAHHPYPARPTDTPFSGGCKASTCKTITMANLERLLTETARAFGPKRIWLTEYAYQTGKFGVSKPRQAELIGQGALRVHRTPRVDLLVHYLVRDEPSVERFQSGLYSFAMRAKPAALAFPFPLAQAGRSSGRLVLWGQVRPRTGAQTFRVQVRTGGAWRWQGGTRRTTTRGYFSVGVPAPKRAQVRIWSPRDAAYSAAIVAR
jgi:polysaccharide biosynthesis protein PslG